MAKPATRRPDPYRDFRFRVAFDGVAVAGRIRIDALSRLAEPVDYRDGTDPNHVRQAPGPWRLEPLTIERALTDDRAFADWADAAWAAAAGKAARKDVGLELLDAKGRVEAAWLIRRCWPRRFTAVTLIEDGDEPGPAIERLVLAHDGWERVDPPSVARPLRPGKGPSRTRAGTGVKNG